MPGSCEGGGLCRDFVSCSARGELPFLCRHSCRFQKKVCQKTLQRLLPGSCEGGGSAAVSFSALLVRVSLLRASPGPCRESSPFCAGKADGQRVIFWCGFVQKGDPAGLFLKRGGFVAFFCNGKPRLEGLVRGSPLLPAGGRRGKPSPISGAGRVFAAAFRWTVCPAAILFI